MDKIEKEFVQKIQEIKSDPYKLRRTINKWPCYESLNKIIIPFLNDKDFIERLKKY